jgi:hypothetical protein
LSRTSGAILRFLASASALSKIAERLFNIWRKTGTEASYIERDIDEDSFCWKKKDDYRGDEHAQLLMT